MPTTPSPLIAIESRLTAALQAAAKKALDLELPQLVLTEPAQPSQGDFAMAACLPLAKRLKRAPRQIAESLVEAMVPVEGVSRLEVAGPGYVNIFLDRAGLASALLEHLEASPAPPRDIHDAPRVDADAPKVVIEHTNINPNKAAHVGHLRNAVLGDCLVRLLQYEGTPVEVQNYIDDTGVQVADVVVGFTAMEGRSPEEALIHVKGLLDQETPFDHVCWHLYPRVGTWYEQDEARLEERRNALHLMEEGEGPLAELGALIAMTVVNCHLSTMARIGVRYDLLPWESDILASQFWAEAFERMKDSGAVHLAKDGKNAGCWVMPLTETEEFKNLEEPDKVIVRGNGTVTYVGKDIAFQMWKFGLIDRDFRYVRHAAPDEREGTELWATNSKTGQQDGHPEFGHASTVYNVIDVRQSYLQAIVRNALKLIGHEERAEQSIHYSYEMVALSPSTAETLGFELSDEQRNSAYVEMSGRKGLGVMADELLDRMSALATELVGQQARKSNNGMTEEEIERAGAEVAVGALRYYMVKQTRNTVIAFDMDLALQFTGETGPYLQYAAVRTANIFRKLEEQGDVSLDGLAESMKDGDTAQLEDDATWALVLAAARLPRVVSRCRRSLEIAHLAKHGFVLCQAFNTFYASNSVLNAESAALKRQRAALAKTFLLSVRELLGLLGLPEPARM